MVDGQSVEPYPVDYDVLNILPGASDDESSTKDQGTIPAPNFELMIDT